MCGFSGHILSFVIGAIFAVARCSSGLRDKSALFVYGLFLLPRRIVSKCGNLPGEIQFDTMGDAKCDANIALIDLKAA